METVRNARKGLIIYFIVLIVLTAVSQYLLLSRVGPIAEHLGLIYPVMWSPAIASIVARLALREGIRDVSFKLKGTFGWKLLAIGWLFPVAVGLIAYGAAWITGLARFTSSMTGFLSSLGITLVLGTLIAVTTATGEEIGWRGYMLTRLFDAKVPHPVLVSALIWGLWHLPLVFSGVYVTGPSPALAAVMFMVFIVPITYFVSWLRLKTGSIWPPIIFHASWNALIQGVFDTSTEGTSIWLGESGILTALVSTVLVIFLVKGRWKVKYSPDDDGADEVRAIAV